MAIYLLSRNYQNTCNSGALGYSVMGRKEWLFTDDMETVGVTPMYGDSLT